MSGGHFNYSQHRLIDIASEIQKLIFENDTEEKDEYGFEVGYHFKKETIDKFKIALDIVKKAYIMVQRIDWLVSGDDSEESFHERWEEDLTKDIMEE